MENVKQSIGEMMSMFRSEMSQFQEKLGKVTSTQQPQPDVVSLEAEFKVFQKFILAAVENLQRQVELLARECDNQEMRGRRCILLLHGVPETESEDTSAIVLNLAINSLGLRDFSSSDVIRSNRLGQAVTGKPRPLVAEFKDVAVKHRVWMSKKSLKGSGVTVAEFLTKVRHSVFVAARKRFGVSKCWTKDGHIYVLGADGKRRRVITLLDLDKIPTGTTSSGMGVGVNMERSRTDPPKVIKEPVKMPDKRKRVPPKK